MKPMTFYKRLQTGLFAITFTLTTFSVHSGSYSGSATVDKPEDADIIAEIVFAIDTSGSMAHARKKISDIVDNTVKTLQCEVGNVDLWVNASFYGFRGKSTDIFDEGLYNFIPRAPDLGDLIDDDSYHTVPEFIAKAYPYEDNSTVDQSYVKAVVSIGDGGDGRQTLDMDAHVRSNRAAIDKNVLLFTIHQLPDAGLNTFSRMQVMSQGGVYEEIYENSENFGNIYEFKDTGGLATQFDVGNTDSDEIKNNLQQVFCRAAKVALEKRPCTLNLQTRAKSGKTQLTWDNEKGRELKLWRSEDDGQTWQAIAQPETTATTYLDKTVVANKAYTYKLDSYSNGKLFCQSLEQVSYSPEHLDTADLNLPPVFDTTPELAFGINEPFSYQVQVSDPEGEAVTLDLKQSPRNATFDETTGLLTWKPNKAGYEKFILIATDDKGAKASQAFILDAKDPKPKFVTSPEPLQVGIGKWRYEARAEDKNDNKLYYTIESVPDSFYATNKCKGKLCFYDMLDFSLSKSSPVVGEKVPIVLSVDDGKGNFDRQAFELEVIENYAPYIQRIFDSEKNYKKTYERILIDTLWQPTVDAQDREGDPITFKLYQSPEGMRIDANTGQISWTPDTLGYYDFDVAAWDANSHNTFSFSQLQVVEPNQPPVFVSEPPADREAKVGIPWTYKVIVDDSNLTTNFDRLRLAVKDSLRDTDDYYVNQLDGPRTDEDGQVYFNFAVQAKRYATFDITLELSDGFETVEQVIEGISAKENLPPAILSIPTGFAKVGEAWTYGFAVRSDDGGTLRFETENLPSGMGYRGTRCSYGSDKIQRSCIKDFYWTPTTEQIGQHTFKLSVKDEWPGAPKITQTITLIVADEPPVNNAPQITTIPRSHPTAQNEWVYDVDAIDSDNNALIYALSQHPSTMQIDATTGVIRWTPTVDDVAKQHQVTATVSDGLATASQSFTLQVFSGVITSDDDPDAPIVDIQTPEAFEVINASMALMGIAKDANFANYKLELFEKGSQTAILLSSGTEVVDGGVLGHIDPMVISNGVYDLRLTASDQTGKVSIDQHTVTIESGFKAGLMDIAFNDLTWVTDGFPLTVNRFYDSTLKHRNGDFGYGWSQEILSARIYTTGPLGRGWQQVKGSRAFVGGAIPTYTMTPLGDHKVFLVMGDDEVMTFDFEPNPVSQDLVAMQQASPTFKPSSSEIKGTLKPYTTDQLLLPAPDSANFTIVNYDGSGEVYNPQKFIYETETGVEFVISKQNGVERIKTPDGKTLIITPNGIYNEDDPDTAIRYTRDGQGRITAIESPNGEKQTYNYDINGDLVQHTDKDGTKTTFEYNDHHGLIKITNPKNNSIEFSYDESGRLTTSKDQAGDFFTVDYSQLASNQFVFTDPMGHQKTVTYDNDGNITRYEYTVTNVLGEAQTAVETFGDFDEDGQALTYVNADGIKEQKTQQVIKNGGEVVKVPLTHVTDPNGLNLVSEIVLAADASKPIAMLDAEGNRTDLNYNATGELVGLTNADGFKAQLITNADGSLSTMDSGQAIVSKREYDTANRQEILRTFSQGVSVFDDSTARTKRVNTFAANDNRLTQVHSYVRDNSGVLQLINTLTYTYDDSASYPTVKVTDDAGTVMVTQYDNDNRIRQTYAEVDGEKRNTQYYYYNDPNHPDKVTTLTYPRSVYDDRKMTYDRLGRLTEVVDLGRTTKFRYDELGRLIETTYPNGATTQTVYSPGGLVLATIDPLGNKTTFEYDSAGRNTKIIYPAVKDAANGDTLTSPTTEFILDKNGRVIQTKDALGNTLSSTFNASGLVTQTQINGQLQQQLEYDKHLRVIQSVDAKNRATRYAYDADDNINQVTEPKADPMDALAPITAYEYNLLGNMTKRTDASGASIAYEYDLKGRLVKQTLPSGVFESYTYNRLGQLASKTDYNGNQFAMTYDKLGRVTEVLATDTNSETHKVTYSYDRFGNLTGVSSDKYGYRGYGYNNMGRLRSENNLSYQYDLAGQLVEIRTTDNSRHTIRYEYDAVGRLITVTDGENTSSYGYDLGSRVVYVKQANGQTTNYAYDANGHLSRMTLTDADGNVVKTLTYNKRSEDGITTSLSDASGDAVSYSFDERDRLTAVTQTGSTALSTTYEYDIVGNRTQMTKDGITTTYTYGPDHQLLSATSPSKTLTFEYDNAGRRTKKTENGTIVTTYKWDVLGNLVKIITDSITTEFFYDPSGERTGKQNSLGRLGYLVSTNNPTGYSQIISQRLNDRLQKKHTYGHRRLHTIEGNFSQKEPTEIPFGDELDNIQAVYDNDGQLIGAFEYDAYGNASFSNDQYGYHGELHDGAESLIYLRARYYDPEVGLFLSRDQYPGEQVNPISQHPYMYANNNPIQFTDPSGYFSIMEMLNVEAIQKQLQKIENRNKICKYFEVLEKLESLDKFMFLGQSLKMAAKGILGLSQKVVEIKAKITPSPIFKKPFGGKDKIKEFYINGSYSRGPFVIKRSGTESSDKLTLNFGWKNSGGGSIDASAGTFTSLKTDNISGSSGDKFSIGLWASIKGSAEIVMWDTAKNKADVCQSLKARGLGGKAALKVGAATGRKYDDVSESHSGSFGLGVSFSLGASTLDGAGSASSGISFPIVGLTRKLGKNWQLTVFGIKYPL